MRIQVGDVITVKEARANARDLPCYGETEGEVLSVDYDRATEQTTFKVKFFIDDSVWCVAEYEIIDIKKEVVIFS